MPETVHNSVQNLRRQANITQEELARVVGVTRQTIIAIEHGHYVPSVLLALKITKVFKKSLEKIFYISYEK